MIEYAWKCVICKVKSLYSFYKNQTLTFDFIMKISARYDYIIIYGGLQK